MNTTGVIIPTLLEAGLLLEKLEERRIKVIQGREFHSGRLYEKNIVLVIGGVGKANAAHSAALLLGFYKPAGVFLLGVAGAYPSSGLRVGEIAAARKEVYGDEGLLSEKGLLTLDALGLEFATVDGEKYYNEFPLHLPDLPANCANTGVFLTVSSCSGALKRGWELEERFGAICENMEGAAVAQVGLMNRTPVTEIRGISNIIEDRRGRPLDRADLALAAGNVQRFFMESLCG